MSAKRAMTAFGGLLVVWSIVMGFVLFLVLDFESPLETPPVLTTIGTNKLTLLLGVADLTLFLIGVGVLACGVIAEISPSRSRWLFRKTAAFTIGYGCAMAAGVVVFVWLDTRSPLQTTLWSVVACVMVALWVGLIRAAQRHVQITVFGCLDDRQEGLLSR